MIFVGNHHQWLVGCLKNKWTICVSHCKKTHLFTLQSCNLCMIWMFRCIQISIIWANENNSPSWKKTPRNEGHSLPEAIFGVMSCDIVISHPEFSSTLPWIAKFFLFFSSFIPYHNQVGSGPHCQLFEPMVCSWDRWGLFMRCFWSWLSKIAKISANLILVT